MTSTPGSPPPHSEVGQDGFFTESVRLFGSFSRHFQALLTLAGMETREAVGLYVRLIVMLLAALLFVFLGYILLILTVAFLIAMFTPIAWVWIALGLAVFHFLVAFLCATHVKKHFATPVFQTTSAEIRKDLALLGKNDGPVLS